MTLAANDTNDFKAGDVDLNVKGVGIPAPFPETLARDHIISWSNPGDTVFGPVS